MNRLPIDLHVQVLSALVEGNSIRATTRITGVAKNTIVKLLRDVGYACDLYMDRELRGLVCKRIECDEIWAFCRMKEGNVPKERKGEIGFGDMWTYVAIDPDTKLIPSWLLGKRDMAHTHTFMRDLAQRIVNRPQITTDGNFFYVSAVDQAFEGRADYTQLIKVFQPRAGANRYSPPPMIGTRMMRYNGDPNPKFVSTSIVERQNLTMRMQMRRFTRLTNGFSKKAENLSYALALHFFHYNFCRKHMTIKTTPAIAAGIENHQWTLHEIARLADSPELPKAS